MIFLQVNLRKTATNMKNMTKIVVGNPTLEALSDQLMMKSISLILRNALLLHQVVVSAPSSSLFWPFLFR